MAKSEVDDRGESPSKKSKKPLLLGVVGAVVLGVGGFYATYSGLILGDSPGTDHEVAHGDQGGHNAESEVASVSTAFVTLPTLTISLGRFANSRHLRFSGSLEVNPESKVEVENILPRVVDVLNTYMRAVSEFELEDPASMNRLRAQMLRRVQIVAGEGNVRDLLILEFVLN